MTRAELREKLRRDPIARAKFIAHTIRYYEDLGLDISEEDLKKFSDEELKKGAGPALSLYKYRW
jgi:hypothetical protein